MRQTTKTYEIKMCSTHKNLGIFIKNGIKLRNENGSQTVKEYGMKQTNK